MTHSHLRRISPAKAAIRPSMTQDARGDVPRSTLDVLDAVSIARGYPSRMALVNEILGNWADKVVHESSLVQRVIAGNPHGAETRGGGKNG